MARVQVYKDFVKDILLRLPVRSVVRFQLVEKAVQSLIRSSEFIYAHVKISSKNPNFKKLIFRGSYYYSPYLKTCSLQWVMNKGNNQDSVLENVRCNPNDIETGTEFSVIGSCDGLVCVFFNSNRMQVFNPTTRVSRSFSTQGSECKYFHFAAWGFGYDELHDDYVVVRLFADTHLQVYSMKMKCWNAIASTTTSSGGVMIVYQRNGRYVNGKLFWIGKGTSDREDHLCCFDIGMGRFLMFEMPGEQRCHYYDLEVLEGRLGIVTRHSDSLDIWLQDSSESWTRAIRIHDFHMRPSYSAYNFNEWTPHPLFLLGDDKVVLYHGMQVTICDATDPDPQYIVSAHSVITYVESLVSPNMDE